MNRQTKQLLALAGVLAVGLGAYAALRVWNAGEEEREAAQATMCSSSAMSPPSPLIPGTAPLLHPGGDGLDLGRGQRVPGERHGAGRLREDLAA